MADNKKLQDVMGVTMDKVKGMIDADSIIGKPINLEDGTIIIPVNRVSYGFASGGSDLPTKQTGNFAGGGGAGVTMEPVAFLVIKNDSVRVKMCIRDRYSTGFSGDHSSTLSRWIDTLAVLAVG